MNPVKYEFGDDGELNERITLILNETAHVFHHHRDGQWRTRYKPKYAAMLATEIAERPSLIKKLLALKDPVVSNITYAAIALNQARR